MKNISTKNIRTKAVTIMMACAFIMAPTAYSAAAKKKTENVKEKIAQKFKDGDRYMNFEITSKKTVKLTGVKDEYKKRFASESDGAKTYLLYIPEKVEYKNKTYTVNEIGAKAFKGDKKLSSVLYGRTIKKVGKEAFANCTNLITFIDSTAYAESKNAVKDTDEDVMTYFDSGVEVIGDKAFQHCSNMSILCLGSKIKKIGSKAFANVGHEVVTIMNENKNLKASGVAKDFFTPSSKCQYVYVYTNVNKKCYLYDKAEKTACREKASHSSGFWKIGWDRSPKIIKSTSVKDFLTGKV